MIFFKKKETASQTQGEVAASPVKTGNAINPAFQFPKLNAARTGKVKPPSSHNPVLEKDVAFDTHSQNDEPLEVATREVESAIPLPEPAVQPTTKARLSKEPATGSTPEAAEQDFIETQAETPPPLPPLVEHTKKKTSLLGSLFKKDKATSAVAVTSAQVAPVSSSATSVEHQELDDVNTPIMEEDDFNPLGIGEPLQRASAVLEDVPQLAIPEEVEGDVDVNVDSGHDAEALQCDVEVADSCEEEAELSEISTVLDVIPEVPGVPEPVSTVEETATTGSVMDTELDVLFAPSTEDASVREELTLPESPVLDLLDVETTEALSLDEPEALNQVALPAESRPKAVPFMLNVDQTPGSIDFFDDDFALEGVEGFDEGDVNALQTDFALAQKSSVGLQSMATKPENTSPDFDMHTGIEFTTPAAIEPASLPAFDLLSQEMDDEKPEALALEPVEDVTEQFVQEATTQQPVPLDYSGDVDIEAEAQLEPFELTLPDASPTVPERLELEETDVVALLNDDTAFDMADAMDDKEADNGFDLSLFAEASTVQPTNATAGVEPFEPFEPLESVEPASPSPMYEPILDSVSLTPRALEDSLNLMDLADAATFNVPGLLPEHENPMDALTPALLENASTLKLELPQEVLNTPAMPAQEDFLIEEASFEQRDVQGQTNVIVEPLDEDDIVLIQPPQSAQAADVTLHAPMPAMESFPQFAEGKPTQQEVSLFEDSLGIEAASNHVAHPLPSVTPTGSLPAFLPSTDWEDIAKPAEFEAATLPSHGVDAAAFFSLDDAEEDEDLPDLTEVTPHHSPVGVASHAFFQLDDSDRPFSLQEAKSTPHHQLDVDSEGINNELAEIIAVSSGQGNTPKPDAISQDTLNLLALSALEDVDVLSEAPLPVGKCQLYFIHICGIYAFVALKHNRYILLQAFSNIPGGNKPENGKIEVEWNSTSTAENVFLVRLGMWGALLVDDDENVAIIREL